MSGLMLNLNNAPMPFSNIITSCEPLADISISACTDIMSKVMSAAANATMNLFGGLDGFCKLPELSFDQETMFAFDYLDSFKAKHLCGPVMRGVDHVGRPFVTFGVQQVAADPDTHQAKATIREACAFTLFKRHPQSFDDFLWMSAGHPAEGMKPLNTASVQSVDKEGTPRGDFPKLEKLLKNGFLVKGSNGTHNIELHLLNEFKKDPSKDEL